MNKIINMTPHPINILDKDNRVTVSYPESGKVARVDSKSREDGHLDADLKAPAYKVEYGALNQYEFDEDGEVKSISAMPEPSAGVLYAVSSMAFDASDRKDLICPFGEVRDRNEKRQIIGVRGFRVK